MNELAERIASEIKNRGVISFADFMRLALYCPNLGFYEKEKDRIGRRGDFFTSVSVGKVFGELLAFQFAEWLEEAVEQAKTINHERSPFHLVEAGANRGDLARDILRWLREHRTDLFGAVQYWIIEPSDRQREHQRATLAEFEGRVRWFDGLAALEAIQGVIFSNELLDAMPVHRIGWQRSELKWIEWGVARNATGFTWAPMTDRDHATSELVAQSWLSQLPSELLDVLPDGFITEISPETESWWSAAARMLRKGRILTIDYGFSREELLAPERPNGTLRGYREHHFANDILASPGEQDLTAHINFSALLELGEAAGLKTELFTTQSRFLTSILSRALSSTNPQLAFTSAEIRQFRTLASPDHLGHPFRVLIQSRAV